MKATSAVGAIIFDLGRTLVPFSFDCLEPALGRRRPQAMELASRYEIGGCSEEEFQQGMCELAGLPRERLGAWWCQIFALEPLIEPSLIRRLRQNWRLGLLSNTNRCHFEFLRARMPFLGELDFYSLSYKVGAAKPQALIYADAERKADCPPHEILYFDDVPEFVTAASKRGWQSHVFRGQEALLASLTASGVRLDWGWAPERDDVRSGRP